MASTFRLYGPEVGFDTAYIDADVTGVSMGGDIELTRQSDGTTFSLTSERLKELVENDMAYDKEAIDAKDDLWLAIDDVEDHRKKDKEDDAPFRAATELLFCGYS